MCQHAKSPLKPNRGGEDIRVYSHCSVDLSQCSDKELIKSININQRENIGRSMAYWLHRLRYEENNMRKNVSSLWDVISPKYINK